MKAISKLSLLIISVQTFTASATECTNWYTELGKSKTINVGLLSNFENKASLPPNTAGNNRQFELVEEVENFSTARYSQMVKRWFIVDRKTGNRMELNTDGLDYDYRSWSDPVSFFVEANLGLAYVNNGKGGVWSLKNISATSPRLAPTRIEPELKSVLSIAQNPNVPAVYLAVRDSGHNSMPFNNLIDIMRIDSNGKMHYVRTESYSREIPGQLLKVFNYFSKDGKLRLGYLSSVGDGKYLLLNEGHKIVKEIVLAQTSGTTPKVMEIRVQGGHLIVQTETRIDAQVKADDAAMNVLFGTGVTFSLSDRSGTIKTEVFNLSQEL